jgi:prolyl oligopeptidase
LCEEILGYPAGMKSQYPKTRKSNQIDTYFGTKVADPYRGLEDDNAAETKAWVQAQNKVTFAYLEKLAYRAPLKVRLSQLVNFPRSSGAFQRAGLIFTYKNTGLQNQSVLYVQQGLTGKLELLLDPNTFAADGTARLTGFVVSKDAKYAAFGVSKSGSDWNDCQIIEIATKKILPETLTWLKFGIDISWRGSEGFFYSRYPQPEKGKELTAKNENQKIYFHKVGTPQSDDALVYEDRGHPDRDVRFQLTEDESYELLSTGEPGKQGNALFFRAAGSQAAFTPIVPQIGEDSFQVLDNVEKGLLIVTNQKAPNQKVLLYDTAQGGTLAIAKVVIPETKENINSINTVGKRLIVSYLKDATTRVRVYDYQGKHEGDIPFPGPGSVTVSDGEHDAKELFADFTSYNYPSTLFRYSLETRKSEVFWAPQLKGYQPSNYHVEQAFYKSKDGTRVPIFVLSKKGLKKNGTNPTLLYGYGGFNVSLTPYFDPLLIAWLEQGGVYAVANLRGGAEYGEKWHEAGMRERKQNVFDDCIAAAQWLIHERYTSPAKLALQGGSNGGLLVGAVINQRPELFAAALPAVGVMDMLRFQRFTAGKYWTAEYGSSTSSAKEFRTLYAYSPLHNIRKGGNYPAVMVTTADHDDRVVPAHSFKYTATLQERASHQKPLLIRIETKSGHGSSSLSKAIEETADTFAFLFANLAVKPRF